MLSSATSVSCELPPSDEGPFFVCVHVGAGHHALEDERNYRRLMNHSCRVAAEVLSRSGDLNRAVAAGISTLEDSELTNAGHGSNLNYEAEVECDASLMLGNSLFGAIGAAPGIKNPIQAACLLAQQSAEPMLCGRVRPIFLAGDGARRWALQEGLTATEDATAARTLHVTEPSQQRWKEYREMIDRPESSPPEQHTPKLRKTVNDTVGCIVANAAGEVCSGVSSGGIALKTPGRVGEAAIYGAGCWARNASSPHGTSVACSVSGVGEVVTRGLLARFCAESLTKNSPLDSIKETIESHTSHLTEPKEVGVISVRASSTRRKGQTEMHVELCVVHNAESMGFSYLTANAKPATRFLRHDGNNGSIAEYGACHKWPLTETREST